jgi:glutathione S-transferase
MDSVPISQFLETTYPDPPVPLTSELGTEIEAKARANGAKAFRLSILPREMNILSPRAQEFFRRSREASLGHPLEDLLDAEKEEQAWKDRDEGMREVSDLIQTHKAEVPFVLGAKPSYTDFFIAGNLQTAKVVDEKVFQRSVKYPGHRAVYEACQPWMERKD